MNSKRKAKTLAFVVSGALTLGGLSIAADSDVMAQEEENQVIMPGAEGEQPTMAGGMVPGAEGMESIGGAHDTSAVYISDGVRQNSNEYGDNPMKVKVADSASGITGTGADGILMTSDDYEATGIVVSNGIFEIGGETDYYTVYSDLGNDYVGTSIESGKDYVGTFNSVILLTLDTPVSESAVTGASAVDCDNSAEVSIKNTYMQVDGAQRYVSSSYGSGKTVVNDSCLVSTGNKDGMTEDIALPFSNEALLISGAARTNFSIGSSDTYYFNSMVVAEGWAALSTDSSTGDGLDLTAYNTTAKALNGGYGTYADFGCRVRLYGSRIYAAEIGAIISKSGDIAIDDGAACSEEIMALNSGEKTDQGSVIEGGRNAVMLHAPDMMGNGIASADCGILSVTDSTLITSRELQSSFDYAAYGTDVKQYVDYVSGDDILIKSTSCSIDLKNTVMESYSGVLIHSVLNADGMGNFLAEGNNEELLEDGSPAVKPLQIEMMDMAVTGDVLHEDYQRNMDLKLLHTTLVGRITKSTYDEWKSYWNGQGITEANWLPNLTWDGDNELSLTVDSSSKWTVTGTSKLDELTVSDGAVITDISGTVPVMTVNGVATPLKAGYYQGDIIIGYASDDGNDVLVEETSDETVSPQGDDGTPDLGLSADQVPADTYYTVVQGDSLSKIAAVYGTTWQELQTLNEIKNPDLIFPGQKIRLP